jgi:predicted dinucleotide-binding enzyme
MRIGIIGSGMIGGTLGVLFARTGHEVALSNSRGPESLKDQVAQMGAAGGRAATVEEAASFGEVVLLAVPFRKPEALPRAETVRGKIVIDAMNPYAEGGGLIDLGDATSSEVVAERLPGARLVKAFNTLHYRLLQNDGRPGTDPQDRLAVFLAGDDPDAKDVVAALIEEIGFAPVDTGSLHEGGRRQGPESPLYNVELKLPEAREALTQVE